MLDLVLSDDSTTSPQEAASRCCHHTSSGPAQTGSDSSSGGTGIICSVHCPAGQQLGAKAPLRNTGCSLGLSCQGQQPPSAGTRVQGTRAPACPAGTPPQADAAWQELAGAGLPSSPHLGMVLSQLACFQESLPPTLWPGARLGSVGGARLPEELDGWLDARVPRDGELLGSSYGARQERPFH